MMDKEFQKHFRIFPKVFHTQFLSTTAERLAFGVIDAHITASRCSVNVHRKFLIYLTYK